MARAISSRRSRGTFGTYHQNERRCNGCGTLGLERGTAGGRRRLYLAGEGPGDRDRRDVATQCGRLEPWRPRGLHERLRARLAHELRERRPRAVRLAEAV